MDHRADIYALGVVFYQMLTGELPGKPLEPPSRKVQIDVRLDEVVLRALERKPELRYQQASILKTQVETIAATPRPSNEAAPKSDSRPRVSLSYVSTPEHLRTFLGRFYNFQAKGELRLDGETLSFDSGWSVVKIPLASISALAVGAYPVSVIKVLLWPANYLAVTFTEHGVSRTLLLTTTPRLNTVRTWVRHHCLTDPRKKVRENMIVLTEWSIALQEAIRASTGNRLPLGVHSEAKTPSRWNQAMWFALSAAFIAMLGRRPLLDVLSGLGLLPGPITTALAAVNSLPGIARAAAGIAISFVDAGLFLLLILVLVHLLIKLSVAVGPLSRKRLLRFANSFPPQPTADNSWLAIVDSGKYAESWEMAAASFQSTTSKEEWMARLEKVRRPLGKVISRQLRSVKHTTAGKRQEVRFDTSFEGLLAAVETVTFAAQPNSEWKAIGYLIRPADARESEPEEAQPGSTKPRQSWCHWWGFQSPEAGQVCAHLTREERRHLSVLQLLYGVWLIATAFGLPALTRTMRSPDKWIVTTLWVGLFLVSLPMIYRTMRHFLCSTQWARQQGLTPPRLPLFSFPASNVARALAVLGGMLLLIYVVDKAMTCYLGEFRNSEQVSRIPKRVGLKPPTRSPVLAIPAQKGDIGVYLLSLGTVESSTSVLFPIVEDHVQEVVKKFDAGESLTVDAYDRQGTQFGHGSLSAVDNRIDPATATLTCKARIEPLRGNLMIPGLFLDIRMLLEVKHGVVLVPAGAIQRDPETAFVWVVKSDQTVSLRPILVGTIEENGPASGVRPWEKGQGLGPRAEVKEGLLPGEIVVIDGYMNLQEGRAVSYKLVQPSTNPVALKPIPHE